MTRFLTIFLTTIMLLLPVFSSTQPTSTQPQKTQHNDQWNENRLAELGVIQRHIQQQIANPGATPEPAFLELPENLQYGAQQAVEFHKEQQSSFGQTMGH